MYVGFFKALEDNKHLRVLKINEIHLKDLLDELANLLTKNSSLQDLEIRGENFRRSPSSRSHSGYFPLQSVIIALHSNTGLKRLDIRFNNLCSSTIKMLLDELITNTHLLELKMGQVTIDDEYAPKLESLLTCNNTLNSLTLEDCSLNAKAKDHLGLGLANNETLTDLNLSGNNITLSDKSFFESLATNNTLRKLNLENNPIGFREEEFILEWLQYNCSMTHLSLSSIRLNLDLWKDLLASNIYLIALPAPLPFADKTEVFFQRVEISKDHQNLVKNIQHYHTRNQRLREKYLGAFEDALIHQNTAQCVLASVCQE